MFEIAYCYDSFFAYFVLLLYNSLLYLNTKVWQGFWHYITRVIFQNLPTHLYLIHIFNWFIFRSLISFGHKSELIGILSHRYNIIRKIHQDIFV
jgi:hypothetical protein